MDQYIKLHALILAFVLVRMGGCHNFFLYIVLVIFHIIFVIVFAVALGLNVAILGLALGLIWDGLKFLYVKY